MFHSKQYTLVQYTPILHFQHENATATIRATELKPKLDRFIWDYYKDLFPDKYEQSKGTLLSTFRPVDNDKKEKRLSYYKVQITAFADSRKYLATSSTSFNDNKERILRRNDVTLLKSTAYFAQEQYIDGLFQGEGAKFESASKNIKVWGKMSKNDQVLVKFKALEEEVLEIIDDMIPYFLAITNFGTRQNKGFGSFYLKDKAISDTIYSTLVKHGIISCAFYYAFDIRNDYLNQVLRIINQHYKVLKSGVNHKGYIKSLLFDYFCNQHDTKIRWEKRTLKKQISDSNDERFSIGLKQNKYAPIDKNNRNSWDDLDKYDYKYVRSLLGIAEQIEFLTDHDDIKYVVKVDSQEVGRFQSPITFKVIGNCVYLIADQKHVDRILDKPFSFEAEAKNKRISRSSGNITLKELTTPTDFNIANFLQTYLNNDNEDSRGIVMLHKYTTIAPK